MYSRRVRGGDGLVGRLDLEPIRPIDDDGLRQLAATRRPEIRPEFTGYRALPCALRDRCQPRLPVASTAPRGATVEDPPAAADEQFTPSSHQEDTA
jgi:hypothetical protein